MPVRSIPAGNMGLHHMATKKDNGFTTRALMVMANEIAQAEESVKRARTVFEALAKEHGVRIPTTQVA